MSSGSSGISVKDFPIGAEHSNISEIKLAARYPEQGCALNAEAEMVAYVLNGATALARDGREEIFGAGSVAVVKRGEKYFWQPQGEVILIIFSAPPWTPSQQQLFE